MNPKSKRWFRLPTALLHFVLLGSMCFAGGGCRSSHRNVISLSVAASLQNSIIEIESAYQRDHAVQFRNNFGASGTLAREIEQGAPVAAFLSAGAAPMDQLQREGLVIDSSRVDLLRNALVLIAPAGSSLKGFEGLTASQIRTIALGDPASVPAGLYGLQSKLVLGKDVRQVLTYVETGNADAGLVYATDAELSQRVQIVSTAPETSHDPIVYPVAQVKNSENQASVQEFISFLRSPAARAIFERHGFRMA